MRAHRAFHHEFGGYLNLIIKQVDREWHRGIRDQLRRHAEPPASGSKVEVTFVIDRFGKVNIGKVEGDAAQVWKIVAVDAIAAATHATGGYGTWTEDMITRLGDRQELVFTFVY